MHQLLVLRLYDRRFALRLRDVERVLRMVEITALPDAPPKLLGVINLQGRVVSVIDLRRCCGLPPIEVEPEQVLVLVRRRDGKVALAADGVEGAVGWEEEVVIPAEEIQPPPLSLEGVAKLGGTLVPVLDLDRLLQDILSP